MKAIANLPNFGYGTVMAVRHLTRCVPQGFPVGPTLVFIDADLLACFLRNLFSIYWRRIRKKNWGVLLKLIALALAQFNVVTRSKLETLPNSKTAKFSLEQFLRVFSLNKLKISPGRCIQCII